MTHTKDGAAESAATSSLVVDLAGKMKDFHSPQTRGPKITLASSSTIYIFPSRRAPLPRTATTPPLLRVEHDAAQAHACKQVSARLPRWIRSMTTRHALVLGTAACYLLIIFNLIYGVASVARLNAWRPVPAASAIDLQRHAMAAPVECERASNLRGTAVPAEGILSVLCATDRSFGGTLDDIFPQRPVTREPRYSRAQ
jgi:hypothetical protein